MHTLPITAPPRRSLPPTSLRTPGILLALAAFLVALPAAAAAEPAPEWSLVSSGGETVRSEDLRGQVVVLDFWATWCGYCQRVAPQAQALHEELAEQPVRVFGVNVFENGDPVAYMKERGLTYDLLLDGEPLFRMFGFTGQPAAVVIGPEGGLLHRVVGAVPDREEQLRRAIGEGLDRLDPAAEEDAAGGVT